MTRNPGPATALQAKQEELLQEYCGTALTKIARASDREEALRMKGLLCAQLEQECTSELVVNATKHYIDSTLERLWPSRSQ